VDENENDPEDAQAIFYRTDVAEKKLDAAGINTLEGAGWSGLRQMLLESFGAL
jgi:hypothetical protein